MGVRCVVVGGCRRAVENLKAAMRFGIWAIFLGALAVWR